MLTVERLVALTRERLGARERRVVVGGPLVKAAVLVPIVDRGEPFLVRAIDEARRIDVARDDSHVVGGAERDPARREVERDLPVEAERPRDVAHRSEHARA